MYSEIFLVKNVDPVDYYHPYHSYALDNCWYWACNKPWAEACKFLKRGRCWRRTIRLGCLSTSFLVADDSQVGWLELRWYLLVPKTKFEKFKLFYFFDPFLHCFILNNEKAVLQTCIMGVVTSFLFLWQIVKRIVSTLTGFSCGSSTGRWNLKMNNLSKKIVCLFCCCFLMKDLFLVSRTSFIIKA